MIYNWIQRLKIKKTELSLFKNFPWLLDTKNLDDFYIGNIKWWDFDEIFFKTFWPKEVMNKKKLYDEWNVKYFNYQDFKNIRYRVLQNKISKNKPRVWYFSDFSLSLAFDEKEFGKINSSSLEWTHLPQTIINTLRYDEKKSEMYSTMKHEQVHNSLECFLPWRPIIDFRVRLSTFLKKELKIAELWAPVNVFDKDFEKLEIEVRKYFRSSTWEILSDFHELERWDISEKSYENIKNIERGTISTALTKYDELITYISEEIKNFEDRIDDKRIKWIFITRLILLRGKICNMYKKTFKDLADMVFIWKKEGLLDEIFALIAIYWMDRSEKICKWLKNRIWEDRYFYYTKIRGIIRPQFFRLPKLDVWWPIDELYYAIHNIKRTLEKHEIEEEDNPLNIEDLEKLSKITPPPQLEDVMIHNALLNWIWKDELWWILEENWLDSIEKLDNYCKVLKKNLDNLKIDKESIENLLSKFYEEFEYFSYSKVITWEYRYLYDLIINLNPKYEYILENAAINYLNESEDDEMLNNNSNKIELKARIDIAISILARNNRTSKYITT